MPVNPIDIQMLVPRAAETSRVQHVRDVVPQNDQQTLAGKEKVRHQEMQKQVQHSEEAVKPANEDDQEKKKRQRKGHNKAVAPEESEPAVEGPRDSEDPNRGHLIDYSV